MSDEQATVTTAQLGDIASIVRGIAFPKEDKRAEPLPGHVACLRTTNVQRTVEWEDLWFVPEKRVKREDQIVRPGDILISTANSYELVGKVAPVVGMPHKATLGAVTIPRQSRGLSNCEPLKAAKRGRSRGPNSWRHLYGGNLSPQPKLLQSRVFLLLVPDVVANDLLVPTDS